MHGWFTDDTPKRFAAYGWQVIKDVDGHDGEAVAKALKRARAKGGDYLNGEALKKALGDYPVRRFVQGGRSTWFCSRCQR